MFSSMSLSIICKESRSWVTDMFVSGTGVHEIAALL